ncbi:MAG: hypothetical protein KF691_01335 [Phycisphaeraceae bacterium]|nr:hypothetical protein [Phycisphaeraceae bacterium]
MRTLRNSARFFSSFLAIAFVATLLVACASSNNNDSQWNTDDGGYGGTGRFNPVGSSDSGDQWNNAGSNY